MTRNITMAFLCTVFLVSVMAVPGFASDTTTTEVGATVEQTMTIAPPSATSTMNPTDDGGATVQNDIVSVDNNQGGDSVTVTVNPTGSSNTTGSVSVPDYLAINSNVDFDIAVKAHSDHTDGDGDGTVDFIYSGNETDPGKPVSDVTLTLEEIGSSSTSNLFDISASVSSLSGSYQTATTGVPADKYYDNNEGLDVDYQISETTPSSMPSGFYNLKLVWQISATN